MCANISPLVHVIIAAADPLIAEGLSQSLSEPALLLAHPVTRSPHAALDRCRDYHPSVLLISESDLERIDPVRFAEQADSGRGVPVLVMGAAPDPARVIRCLSFGCMGYVTLRDSLATLRKAVYAVAAGEIWAPRTVLTLLLRQLLDARTDEPRLTLREREILGLIQAGHSNDEICNLLFISPETVRWHLRRLFAKIGAKDRAGAAEFARLHLAIWRVRPRAPSPTTSESVRSTAGPKIIPNTLG